MHEQKTSTAVRPFIFVCEYFPITELKGRLLEIVELDPDLEDDGLAQAIFSSIHQLREAYAQSSVNVDYYFSDRIGSVLATLEAPAGRYKYSCRKASAVERRE